MKTCVLGFIFLGLTSLMSAQNDLAVLTASNQSEYSNTKTIHNADYINTMSDLDVSKKILKLQNIVANYNIKTAKVYRSKSNTTYTVKFNEGDNQLRAIYDREGKLLSSQETYQNIKLPYSVSSELVKDNPGWSLNQVYCDIQFIKDVDTQIVYRVVLKNGKKTKTVTINV